MTDAEITAMAARSRLHRELDWRDAERRAARHIAHDPTPRRRPPPAAAPAEPERPRPVAPAGAAEEP